MSHMLARVAFVPGQNQHAVEPFVGAGEPLARIIDRLRPGQRKRPAALAKRPLRAKDFAGKRRLLYVARSGEDAPLLERRAKLNRAADDDSRIDVEAIFPIDVDVAGADERRGESR